MSPPPEAVISTLKMKEESLALGSSFSMREPDYEQEAPPRYWDRIVDGFKREHNSTLFSNDPLGNPEGRLEGGRVHNGAHYYDLHLANLETANAGLARKLKGRHLQMIAIGGSIGTSHAPLGGNTIETPSFSACCKNLELTLCSGAP